MLSCVLFFFFKQNTAYEMRISDWSSDVCSSDLLPALAIACHQHVGRFQVLVQHADAVRRGNSVGDLEKQMQALLQWQRGEPRWLRGPVRKIAAAVLAFQVERQLVEVPVQHPDDAIGRESCRERVWHEV